MSEDRREIIAWYSRSYWNRSNITFGSEISDETGTFRTATASLTFQTEDPAVHVASGSQVQLAQVRVATPEQKQNYLSLVAQMNDLRTKLKECEKEIALTGQPITWEWIQQHGKQHQESYVPIPHHSKMALANLRKGSRVVISTTSSAYAKIAGKVGKVVKKRSKFVIVQFGTGRWKIPYPDLKPAKEVDRKRRAEIQRGSEANARISGEMNKLLRGDGSQ